MQNIYCKLIGLALLMPFDLSVACREVSRKEYSDDLKERIFYSSVVLNQGHRLSVSRGTTVTCTAFPLRCTCKFTHHMESSSQGASNDQDVPRIRSYIEVSGSCSLIQTPLISSLAVWSWFGVTQSTRQVLYLWTTMKALVPAVVPAEERSLGPCTNWCKQIYMKGGGGRHKYPVLQS